MILWVHACDDSLLQDVVHLFAANEVMPFLHDDCMTEAQGICNLCQQLCAEGGAHQIV